MMLEDACISFVPYLPRDKHGDGGHGFTPCPREVCHREPPIRDRVEIAPTLNSQIIEPKATPNHLPNVNGEAALEHDVGGGFGLHST